MVITRRRAVALDQLDRAIGGDPLGDALDVFGQGANADMIARRVAELGALLDEEIKAV
ncbi:hypothetical protein D3C85_1853190 [compost metagenome]